MSEDEKGPSIETFTGKKFYIHNPEFDIRDIAHSLGQHCRFAGQAKQFYSVAEHSLLVLQLTTQLELGYPLEALMHDAHEAYLGDMAAPWKSLLPDYRALERLVAVPLRAWAGLPADLSDGVKRADMLARCIEARLVMPSRGEDFVIAEDIRQQAAEFKFGLAYFSPSFAKTQFWEAYNHLVAAREAKS